VRRRVEYQIEELDFQARPVGERSLARLLQSLREEGWEITCLDALPGYASPRAGLRLLLERQIAP
jgi:hypothetical protein